MSRGVSPKVSEFTGNKVTDILDQKSTESQAYLTVAQTILFSCKKASVTVNADSTRRSRHSLSYEPPLPLYIEFNIHTQTVLELERQLATAVCDDIDKKGVVCPTQVRKGIFTVGALDYLDHNPSSTTAKDSFHGAGINFFQSPTRSKMGTPQDINQP